ncbi:hypothetical protein [Pelagicoccus sp. SDUM812005]|uniref:tetratricopeptide repeat protein n=1 Tax=Pelagicoccus sp. SDUM812005 TaxID=3041257 RepID=UPI0028102313|nr:hypothetical protein [Pelagicoccus sp. SDUM812005]MDQ8183015.1 hypothetical protein [Pelagicoccus sp. SDUM812005]
MGVTIVGEMRLLGCSLFAWVLAFFLGASVAVSQEDAPEASLEIPLAGDVDAVDLKNLSDSYWLKGSAHRALAAGLYDVAYSLAVRAKALEELGWVDFANELVIVDSLLARSQWVEARLRLAELAELPRAPQRRIDLREAMIAYAESDADAVRELLSGVAPSSLGVGDAAWFWFLRGWAELAEGDDDAAAELFASARDVAAGASPALGAQIGYLVFRSQLESRTASAETIPQLQNAVLESGGREVRFLYAQQLAVLLFDSGDEEAAIRLIMKNLAEIPGELALERAQFQLLATMAAGLGRVEGRQAMSELIAANRFPDLMSIALQQAFSRARLEDGEGGDEIRAVLDRVIAREREHVLLDQALYYRAVFRFLDDDFLGAEDDAAELQKRFPNSPYRRGVLALQASSAWNRYQYRKAANRLQQMRMEFSDLQRDYRLSALIADCYLRAGLQSNTREEFRNAAEAYAAALSNVSSESQGGPLFFQLIYSRLRAGQLDLALEAIDNPALRSLAGSEMVWRAQWMALREMRRVERVSEAYERAQEAVLGESENPLLKLRLLWLTARLSAVAGDPEYTIDWVNEIEAFVASEAMADADQDLLNKVLASSLLSLSESHFALEEPEEAVALLERLRKDYAGYESALLSYISQARYLSRENRTVEAQQLLVSLADEYPDHRLAPVALFEAALNSEQRGQDAYLDEATKLLQRIASDYPESEIVYQARLMQADLLRRLNKFGSAEQIYYLLENEYADHPKRFFAQMSMADTLLAQAEENPSKFDGAVSRLELLMDLPEASLDLRVEAGYKLGQAWRSRGEALKAKQLFWLVYDQMLVEDLGIRKLTNKGRYWVARCLFGLAELAKEEGKIDESNSFYRKIIEHRLNGVELAKARLGILEPETGAAVPN